MFLVVEIVEVDSSIRGAADNSSEFDVDIDGFDFLQMVIVGDDIF
jgi:hypothetical protein